MISPAQILEWKRAVRMFARQTKLSIAIAHGIVDRLEDEGVTEKDIDDWEKTK